jgi:heat shock protein HtpX
MTSVVRTSLLLAALAAAVAAGVVALAGPALLGPALVGGALLGVAIVLGAGALLRRLYGARPADESSAPGVVRLVREIAGVAGLPVPRVWLVDDSAPAAFATGVVPRRAAIVLTTGLVALLSERELRAVIAHELAHIRRHDTGTAALCVALVGLLPLLALAGLRALDDDAAGDGDDSPPWLLGALAPLAAVLLNLVLSVTREYDADRLAGRWCGDPSALADALARIERVAARRPLRAAMRHPQTGLLLTVPTGLRPGWPHWLAAQPSIEGRIERLLAQARADRAQV